MGQVQCSYEETAQVLSQISGYLLMKSDTMADLTSGGRSKQIKYLSIIQQRHAINHCIVCSLGHGT